jgi:hypothetical protein
MSGETLTKRAVVIFEAEDRMGEGLGRVRKAIADTKADAGKAVNGDAVEAASGKAKAGLDRVLASVQRLPGPVGASASAIESMGRAMGGASSAALGWIAVAGAVVVGLYKLSELSITASNATQNLQISLDGAREAYHGTVSDLELATQANKAFKLGVVENGREFGQLAEGVNAIARQLGEDSTQLMDNATTAIGRGSALILDNLGIILDNAKAQEIYAASLGKSVSELTEFEKSQAFAKAATMEIAKAGREAAGVVEGFASEMDKAAIKAKNFAGVFGGFDADVGRVREAFRALDADTLEALRNLDSREGQGSVAIERALRASAEAQAAQARAAGDSEAQASDFLATMEQVKKVADELGEVEKMRGGQLDFANRMKREKEIQKLAEQALRHQAESIAKAKARDAIAAKETHVKELEGEAALLQHQAEILQLSGGTQKEINAAVEEALYARLAAAEAAGNELAILEAQWAIEKQIATSTATKRGGGGRGPSDADRLAAAGEQIVQQYQQQAALAAIVSRIEGTTEADRRQSAELSRQALSVELELERQVLEITKAKNSVERQSLQNRLEANRNASELNDLEVVALAREHERDLIAQAVEQTKELAALDQERARQESEELAEVIELDAFRNKQRAAEIKDRANAEAQAAHHQISKMAIMAAAESDLHGIRMENIEIEARAKARGLDAREEAANALDGSGTDPAEALRKQDELRQVHHEREILRLETTLAKRRELEAESQRIAQAEEARLKAQLGLFDQVMGGLNQIQGQVSGIITTELGRQREIQDADFEAWKSQLEARGAAQQASLEREIKAAKGNNRLQAELRARQGKLAEQNRKSVERAEQAHHERRKKQEMRQAGFELLIRAAVSTGKAISSYPDFVAMAIHSAAAVLQSAYGFALISGVIPAAGGAGSSSGAANQGPSGVGTSNGDRMEAPRTPESVSAAQRNRGGSVSPRGRGDQQGGSVVVNIGNLYTTSKVDEAHAEQIGLTLHKAAYSREGAA